jgi:hypothetical protein
MADDKQLIADDSKDKAPEINYQRDVHNPDLSDIAAEWEDTATKTTDSAKPAEELSPKKEEKPTEPVKPVEAVKLPEEPVKPVIDEEKLTDNITNKLLEKLTPEDATKQEKKDLKTKLSDLEAKAKEEGRELTYTDALEFLSKETKESVKEELKEEVKKEVLSDLQKEVDTEDAKTREQQAAQLKQQETFTKEWDRQLARLEEGGQLPKPTDMKDPNDPRVKEELALFIQMRDYNLKHTEAPILNVVEFYHTAFKSPTSKPPGADAPVNGARRSVQPTDDKDFTYQSMHNSSLEELAGAN